MRDDDFYFYFFKYLAREEQVTFKMPGCGHQPASGPVGCTLHLVSHVGTESGR